MKHFLYRVAETFFQYHSQEINRFTFVFPNRRAGLFFQQYLAKVAHEPFFSPGIITIEQWFESASELTSADRLYQLFKLYELYKLESQSDESFDSFAFWGEIILNDFNEVDKYLVDASQLFSNITDLKSIDEYFTYLSENQLAAIRSFWKNFNPLPDKASQQEFIATWKILHGLYERFRMALSNENLAYEGMLMRELTDKLTRDERIEWMEGKQFVFVGFNALNPCEKAVMLALQKRDQADFYWDYDAFTLRDPDNPASLFYKENTLLFPSVYSIGEESRSLEDKKFQLINVPSGVGQAKEVYTILNSLYAAESEEKSFLQTAVVLPDEQLLMPLLYSIPEHIKKINVTMGYPMHLTPVAGLMDHLFELQRNKKKFGNTYHFYHQNVSNILNHQFIAEIEPVLSQKIIQKITAENQIYVPAEVVNGSSLLSTIFKADIAIEEFLPYLKDTLLLLYKSWRTSHPDSSNSLEAGFLYQYYNAVNRLQQLIDEHQFIEIVNLDTLIRIIRELTASITVPFVGEPLDGLQIMGVLETRGLDFKNVIICSFNEGTFPGKSFTNSFIPYQLRKGFDLPTFEQADAVTAYNFYRLIHHADSIYFITDKRSEGGSTGEVSRFFYQLKYYYQLEIASSSPSVNVEFETAHELTIQKDERILKMLQGYTAQDESAKSLSASAINTYINCPLQFCLSQLEAVSKPDEITETVESDTFGTIFHAVMAELYEPYTGRIVSQELIKDMAANTVHLNKLLSQAFGHYFFKKPKGIAVELEGNNLLIASVLKKYIKGVLHQDAAYAPFLYIEGEKKVFRRIPTRFGEVNLKGYIDRIDSKEGKVRILDYKTGAGNLSFSGWEDVFNTEMPASKRPKYVLQTFLYGYLYKAYTDQNVISPGIYYLRNVFDEHFSTELSYKNKQNDTNTLENYYEYEDEFIPGLTTCIEEILDPEIPFYQTTVKENCDYCDFKSICKR